MRNDLTSQIKKISGNFATLQSETNARLPKIQSLTSKVDEIDNIKPKVQKLEDVGDTRKSLSTLEETKQRLQKQTEALKKKLECLERHSRDFNIGVLGVVEEEGEHCLSIVPDFLTLPGLQDAGEKWKMPAASQVKNEMENLGILLLNCTADLLNRIFFKSPKARKVKMHSTELDSWKILLPRILRQGRKLSRL